MIVRWLLHVEWHRGYGLLPIVRFGPVPRPGDRMMNGGEPGTLVRCPLCSGDRTLHVPDAPPQQTSAPQP